MSKKRVLIVGGTFDAEGGKPSGLINKIYIEAIKRNDIDITYYNGGYVSYLHNNIIERCKENDITLWMPNVSNTEEKVRNIKEINPKTILISSKRNDDNKYSFAELISRALAMKSNLVIEFSKVSDKKFNMMVFDPLGNEFFKGTNIEKMVKALFDRAIKLTTFTRKPTFKVENAESIPTVPDEEEFFKFARGCSDIFHNLINPSKGTTRFLGNMSFRCQNGFPSFRGENGLIFVSKRNVDKSEITKESFVPCYLNENDDVMYYGDNKPSVDTPIQLRLYKMYPWMNFMIHAHCYVDTPYNVFNARNSFTYNPVPCGALEEVDEIAWTIGNEVGDEEEPADFIAVNLIGHGCLLMAKDVSTFTKLMEHKNNCFVKRPMPENTLMRFKNRTFEMFNGNRMLGISGKKNQLKFTDNIPTIEEFKQLVYKSPKHKLCMIEDEYCCHGSLFNCWEEPYGEGIWFETRKQTQNTIIATYENAYKNHKDRIFVAKRSGRTYIAIVLRDIDRCDFRIYL